MISCRHVSVWGTYLLQLFCHHTPQSVFDYLFVPIYLSEVLRQTYLTTVTQMFPAPSSAMTPDVYVEQDVHEIQQETDVNLVLQFHPVSSEWISWLLVVWGEVEWLVSGRGSPRICITSHDKLVFACLDGKQSIHDSSPVYVNFFISKILFLLFLLKSLNTFCISC